MTMKATHSQLLLIDFQERLMPAVQSAEEVLHNAAILAQAASLLHVPVAVSEQYPRGLGATVAQLLPHVDAGDIHEKTTFSAYREPKFHAALESQAVRGRRQLIIAGVEAHVCVLQTALDCIAAGYQVFLVSDAISSRATASIDAARARVLQAGGRWVTTEMVIFEWLEKAGTPEFKALSALIK